MKYKSIIFPIVVVLVILVLFFIYRWNFGDINYLEFSDAAKYADVARNIVSEKGFGTSFSFYRETNLTQTQSGIFSGMWIAPAYPLSIAAVFKLFGINDIYVVGTSFVYFGLALIFIFLLSCKLFKNDLAASLAMVATGFNNDLVKYSTSGGSEPMFIFEIVASSYFVSLQKKWANIVTLFFLVLMYFTRPQAIVYILGILLYYLFLNFSWKKALVFSVLILFVGGLVYLAFSEQGSIAVTQNLPGIAVSDSLRGGVASAGVLTLVKKVFYNLYNFYKLLPQIMNPYLFALFIIGLFSWGKDRLTNSFKIASIFMIFATFVVTALTIPFFRYIHPVIPFVYIIAAMTLFQIVSGFSVPPLIKISQRNFAVFVTSFLVFVFAVGQTLGVIFLDSRFEKKMYNQDKPPIYVVMSWVLRDNTSPGQVFITNLDTWGSWYGKRKTVWFPLEPKQIINTETRDIPFDGIYLTSYLIDDENHYMDGGWRQIFLNPNDPEKWTCEGCDLISETFKLHSVYEFKASDVYEKIDGRAILLIKNNKKII